MSRRRDSFLGSSPRRVALAASVPLTLALSAGHAQSPTPDQAAIPAAPATPADTLRLADELLTQGKPVAARVLLAAAMAEAPTDASPELRAALQRAIRAQNQLAPAELSLQKAEQAVADRDLRTAQRHLDAVDTLRTLQPEQRDRVATLRADVAARRGELAAIVPDTLAQAERDYLDGRYAQARAGLALVDRSGVPLTPEQQATLDRYQLALVELADQRPEVFGGPAGVAGMMQPGVVRRREDEAPAAQPEPAPAQPAPEVQPIAAQPPAQSEPVPVAQVQPGDTVTSQPMATDPIADARRQEAADLLIQADQAYVEKRFADALSRYDRLRTDFRDVLTPDQLGLAERRASEARVMINADRLGTPQRDADDRFLAQQQIRAEFDNDLEQARRALAGGNATEARNRVAQARLRLAAGRNVFSESELENLQTRANELTAQIDREETRLAEERAARRDEEIQRRAAEAAERAKTDRETKINELIERARAFQAEKRYREAADTIERLLFLDPINPTGLLLQEVYADVLIFDRATRSYNEKQRDRAFLSSENQDAAVPPRGLLNFPSDWPAISARRGELTAFAEPAENRRVLADMTATRVPSVTLTDNTLDDALKFFQTVAQMNLDVDWASLEEAGIRRDTTLSLNLSNVTLRALLDRIVEKVSGVDRASKADWAIIDGVITVASDAKIRRNTALVIYDVKDLLVEVRNFRDAPRIDLQQALQAAGGGGGGSQSPFQDADAEEEDEQVREEARRARMDELEQIITQNVDNEGWVINGGDTGSLTKLFNQGSLIIRNTPKNHREVTSLLRTLREQRAMQINVECRFLLVNQDFFEQIGFDLDIYINADNNQLRTVRRFNPQAQASDFFNFSGIPALNRNIPQSFAFNPPATGGTTPPIIAVPNPDNWSPIGFGGNSLGIAQTIAPQSANWGNRILSGAPALGIAGQFLDDIQVDFLVRATQADRRSAQLTAPRLTFTNGQASNIYVATQTAFISDLQVVTGDSAVGFQPTVGVVTEGVTLLVEGTVTSDRRYVTMTVDGGVSRVAGFATQQVTAVAGGQLVSPVQAGAAIQLPQITVTRVRTTVTIPDQGTLLLGGQRLITEYEVETGVPVLSKIPILNRFFTNRIESKEEQTLMILMKPTILIQNEEEERNFPGLLQSLSPAN